ncbi:hypothetical protein IT415_04095 [bacterium]|nr:hypothetical protein [bacterium]
MPASVINSKMGTQLIAVGVGDGLRKSPHESIDHLRTPYGRIVVLTTDCGMVSKIGRSSAKTAMNTSMLGELDSIHRWIVGISLVFGAARACD